MKVRIVVMVTLMICVWVHAAESRVDVTSLPFYGKIRAARVAANECHELLIEGNDERSDLFERLDRTFIRHLVQRYHPEEWIGEDVFIPAGPGAHGLDLPRFRVSKISGSLLVSVGSKPKFVWFGAKTDRFREVTAEAPFAEDFEWTEMATRIYDRSKAVEMVATYIAHKSGSVEVAASIRSELEIRDHYLMKLDGHLRRRRVH